MQTFETYLSCAEAEAEEDRIENTKKRARRISTREERRQRSWNHKMLAGSIFLWAVLLSAVIGWSFAGAGAAGYPDTVAADKSVPTSQENSEAEIPDPEDPEPEDASVEDFENEKIEAALFDSGYFRRDIPLDGETQALLRAACEESGVRYELACAVIWKETGFQNVVGDDGDSIGYMQIQEKWHGERMARLGVTDLADPFGNFRVGCDYLSDLTNKYSLQEALTAYNSGKPGESQYASDVIAYMVKLSEGVKE